MDLQKINELTRKYTDGTATEAEKKQLSEWYREKAYRDATFPDDDEATYHSILDRINDVIIPPKRRYGYRFWTLAASVTVILGISVYLFIRNNETAPKDSIAAHKNDIMPGGNKAILTLANGSKISLTDAGDGKVASQGGIQISKTAQGQLIYTVTTPNEPDASMQQDKDPGVITYNTIETPVGGQFQVLLPDGSRVWLNALSAIKFPVSFAKAKERRVELRGEAFFVVQHNEASPFKVITGGQTIEDIGTEFNINAYPDDAVAQTTLIKGAVKVTAGNHEAFLKPGQQAGFSGTDMKVSAANIEEVIAWKSGYFKFYDDNLEDIMKTIARWYNIRVIYQDESLKKETFGAVVTRFANISPLLKLMEQTGNANFKIDGATITISKKKN
ncbi:FecR family protein [Mucilaginibacter lappiensis]|uniref:FecR family protein n=1 Tax=Mucilaginibacter lappiensis TaxID=354630 RepID=UPI003D2450C4